MNNLSKGKQLLIVWSIIGIFLVSMCFMGCGKKQSCETLACGTLDKEYGTGAGISIPGCGGCLSSGSGCDSCLWAQSHKISCATFEENDDTATVAGCDTRYFGDGCLGCAQQEKTAYLGFANIEQEDYKMTGCIFGGSNQEEYAIGCVNGCGGCIGTDGIGYAFLDLAESGLGIK